MAVVLKKVLLTLIVTALSVWALHYGILWRNVQNPANTHDKSGNDTKKYFADAWYNYGLKAWYENDLNLAADYFRNAVGVNVLQVDAWLKLAQVETGSGNTETAGDILKFTNDLTRQVVRWKWSQLLLARELKLDDVFWENINFVIFYPQFQNDALHLSDLHLGSDTEAALNVLESRNLPYYLRWLMTWNRTEDTFRVWRFIEENQLVDNDLYDRYVHFLISQKEIRQASEIREKYTGIDGMTNPGFELPISNKGFGWRGRTGAHWDIQRVGSGAVRGNYALQVVFSGEENINFQHLSQIVPVVPEKTYSITFWWRSQDLTTDQRPYIEIRGIDCIKSHWKSDMVPAATDWKHENVLFSIPESCYAVTVNLRRNPSHRFDSKIKGLLWLDHFEMKIMENLSISSEN